MLQPPSLSRTLLTVCGGCAPRTIRIGYTCRNLTRPRGGWAAPEDHERVLRSVIRAAWPDREPTWPAFLEEGAVLRITDADANNWLPRALRIALAHWRYRRHNPPPPQPQPPHKRRRK